MFYFYFRAQVFLTPRCAHTTEAVWRGTCDCRGRHLARAPPIGARRERKDVQRTRSPKQRKNKELVILVGALLQGREGRSIIKMGRVSNALDDVDPETAALLKKLQEEDSAAYNSSRGLGRRDRKAPELYKPPPPGVGGLAKSERDHHKPPSATKDDGGAGGGGGRPVRERSAPEVYIAVPASGAASRITSPPSTAAGGSSRGRSAPTAAAVAPTPAVASADKRKRTDAAPAPPPSSSGGNNVVVSGGNSHQKRQSGDGGKDSSKRTSGGGSGGGASGGGGTSVRGIGMGTPPPGVKHPEAGPRTSPIQLIHSKKTPVSFNPLHLKV
jgi:hypothetical protein